MITCIIKLVNQTFVISKVEMSLSGSQSGKQGDMIKTFLSRT